MTDSLTDRETQCNQLIGAYRQLPTFEQEMLQLLSIAYAPIRKNTFLDCLNFLGKDGKFTRKLNISTFNSLVDKLRAGKFLELDGGQGLKCHPLLVEFYTREAVRSGQFEAMVKAVEEAVPVPNSGWNKKIRFFNSQPLFIREIRVGLYRQDWEFIQEQFDTLRNYGFHSFRVSLPEILELVCNNPFDPDWFRSLKGCWNLYEIALSSILTESSTRLNPAPEAYQILLESYSEAENLGSVDICTLAIEQLLLRGQISEAERFLQRFTQTHPQQAALLWCWFHCLRGDTAQAIELGMQGLNALQHSRGKRKKIYFSTFSGVFLVLALLREGSARSLAQATQYANWVAHQQFASLSTLYDRLESVLLFQQGDLAQKAFLTTSSIPPVLSGSSLITLFCSLCLYWVDKGAARSKVPPLLRPFFEKAQAAGYEWLALEAAELLGRLMTTSRYGQEAKALREKTGIQPLTDLVQPKEPWELCLNALVNLNQTSQTAAPTQSEFRLVWFLRVYPSMGWELQAREQKLNKNGQWSRGRVIALKRLAEEQSSFEYFTAQDRQVCTHIEVENRHSYYGKEYRFSSRALLALVGHPLIFWEDTPTIRLDLVKGEPELMVKHQKDGRLALRLVPIFDAEADIVLVKETPTRLKIIEIRPDHRRIATLLGPQHQLEVPELAQERVLAAINAISSIVTVHSDIGGGVASATEVPANPKPHIHLLPAGQGLKVALLNRPFPSDGPYYRPGAGGETIIAEIKGERFQTTRNLSAEKKLAREVVKACPTLDRLDEQAGEWLIEDPEDCLELLLELQEVGDRVVVEWPEGEKLRITRRADLKDFSMKVQRQRDWFAASGELTLDDGQVLDMQHLLSLLEKTPGRFIPLGEGQFLAMTEEFRKRLDELRTFSERQGKAVRFHPLAGLAMADWVEDVGDFKGDKHWKAHLQKLQEVQDWQPQLPSTLQAELRDYQVEGFQWLARLAHWGVGACLADDMGLGKTVQALAVILTRATAGPTLIVAPTSVCMNWISEAQKFAPTLNPIQLGVGSREVSLSESRQKLLDNLQPFDLLICSYGLLQQEDVAEMLSKVEWQTIVLDEAQAIKNTATKRSKAAMNLQSGFKVITTGTPIENHLGELWNLFRFINPGLLGSLERFNQNFANPIERYQDKATRNRLKKLIQPFILRRTKNQVLEELPARTEITLQVELSQEEVAFYEALRREAIAKLTDSSAEAGAKHLQVLAEIMKLRRACCNARLVMPDVPFPSAKLGVFADLIEELLSNQHKALVFSQFVDHLTLLREHLDKQKIAYQYLDGSTPAAERKKRVDAFQAGQGDVFLISLKAGGTGLNLTAADYVIHMDPWWNPAVEDQASDRAHRIGQQRPVTIYRLVAKDTIEEKIVDLHRQKRDLADSLLEGADMSGKMSTDELLNLLSES